MNREIKFRAWSKADGGVMLQVGDEYGTTHPLDCCNYVLQGQDIELMQYTGLKDKNGVEIYEGDILDFDAEEWGSEFTPEVVAFDKTIGTYDLCGSLSDLCNYRQVIGNIYENPELLGA